MKGPQKKAVNTDKEMQTEQSSLISPLLLNDLGVSGAGILVESDDTRKTAQLGFRIEELQELNFQKERTL
jgi:hypothetical protein